jgi:hypothetical protein
MARMKKRTFLGIGIKATGLGVLPVSAQGKFPQ